MGISVNTWAFQVLGRPAKEDKDDRLMTLSTMASIAEGIITWLTENAAAKKYMTYQDHNVMTLHGNNDELAGVRVEIGFNALRHVASCAVR
jgi:hypothetical protein